MNGAHGYVYLNMLFVDRKNGYIHSRFQCSSASLSPLISMMPDSTTVGFAYRDAFGYVTVLGTQRWERKQASWESRFLHKQHKQQRCTSNRRLCKLSRSFPLYDSRRWLSQRRTDPTHAHSCSRLVLLINSHIKQLPWPHPHH